MLDDNDVLSIPVVSQTLVVITADFIAELPSVAFTHSYPGTFIINTLDLLLLNSTDNTINVRCTIMENNSSPFSSRYVNLKRYFDQRLSFFNETITMVRQCTRSSVISSFKKRLYL